MNKDNQTRSRFQIQKSQDSREIGYKDGGNEEKGEFQLLMKLRKK